MLTKKGQGFLRPVHYHLYYYTSGRPVAMLVKIDRIPARRDVLPTVSQSTSDMTAVVPIAATAVWQIVRSARIPAAFQNSFPIILLPPDK